MRSVSVITCCDVCGATVVDDTGLTMFLSLTVDGHILQIDLCPKHAEVHRPLLQIGTPPDDPNLLPPPKSKVPREYPCPECGKVYKSTAGRSGHRKTVHASGVVDPLSDKKKGKK